MKDSVASGKKMAESVSSMASAFSKSQKDRASSRLQELEIRKKELKLACEREIREEKQQAAAWIQSGNAMLVKLGEQTLAKYLEE